MKLTASPRLNTLRDADSPGRWMTIDPSANPRHYIYYNQDTGKYMHRVKDFYLSKDKFIWPKELSAWCQTGKNK